MRPAAQAARSRASPASRSSIRSDGSSSPTWMRINCPSGAPRPRPAGDAAEAVGIDRNQQTLIAAPAVSHREMAHPVEHGGEGRLVRELGPDREGEKAAGPAEVALPDRMAGILGECRMQNSGDFVAVAQPAGDPECGFLVPGEARRHAAQTAEGEEGIVRGDAEAELGPAAAEFGVGFLGAGDGTEHEVGVPGDVFW